MLSSKVLKPNEDKEAIDQMVKPFEMLALKDSAERLTMKQMKETFKSDLTTKDAQFQLSDLIANTLSVEEDAEKRFQERVKVEIEARLKQIEGEAKEKARVEGLELGKKQAFEEGLRGMKETHERMMKIASDMTNLGRKVFAEHETAMMDFIFHVVSVIARKVVQEDRETVGRVLRDIIERTGARENIKIRLSEEDYKMVSEIQKTLAADVGQLQSVTFEAREGMAPGDCAVETNFGEVRALLEEELKALKEALASKAPKTSHVPT